MYWAIVNHQVLVVDGKNWSFLLPHNFVDAYPDLADDEMRESAKEFRKMMNRGKGVPGLAEDIAGTFDAIDPISGMVDKLSNIIVGLNDEHNWSREAIAGWLDTLPDQPKWKLEDTL